MSSNRSRSRSNRAQAVVELAVFGSIVLYLIGLIISQGTSTSYQQEAQLQAMRIGLLSSYQSALAGQSRRNTASFLILEDRLTSGSGRFGSTDRQPFIAQGGGTMSMHLFKPVDWSDIADQSDVPITDTRINGQVFNFRVAVGARYRIRFYPVNLPEGGLDVSRSHVTISRIHSCAVAYCNPTVGCEELLEDSNRAAPASGIDYNRDAKRLLHEWVDYPMNGYPPAYVSVVKNDDAHFVLPTTCTPANGTEDWLRLRRFDLNRDGAFPDMCCPNPLAYILWQWSWKSLAEAAGEIDSENGTYPSYDVDGDLFEETLYRLAAWPSTPCGTGTVIGYDIDVLDWDRGDINPSVNMDEYPKANQPGLKEDLRITTFQGAGTYMQVKEENNLSAGPPVPMGRSTSMVKKNQEDFIERLYILNDRMLGGGSLCLGGTPIQQGVQACCDYVGCCGEGARTAVTCFEFPTNGIKKLFIRSRIPDKRGRLWATDVTP